MTSYVFMNPKFLLPDNIRSVSKKIITNIINLYEQTSCKFIFFTNTVYLSDKVDMQVDLSEPQISASELTKVTNLFLKLKIPHEFIDKNESIIDRINAAEKDSDIAYVVFYTKQICDYNHFVCVSNYIDAFQTNRAIQILRKDNPIDPIKVILTREDSLNEYRKCIDSHRASVLKAFEDYGDIINNEVIKKRCLVLGGTTELTPGDMFILKKIIQSHDLSKYSNEEFTQYAAKWHPALLEPCNHAKIMTDYKEAWKHHYTHNKHHPEYWVNEVDGKKTIIQMSNYAMLEMICDWIGCSMDKKSNLYDWWMTNNGGREEKKTLLLPEDFAIIDEFIQINKDAFDFSA